MSTEAYVPGRMVAILDPFCYVLNNDFRKKRCDYCLSILKHQGQFKCNECQLEYCTFLCQLKSFTKIHKDECRLMKTFSARLPGTILPNTVRLLGRLLIYSCTKWTSFFEDSSLSQFDPTVYTFDSIHVPVKEMMENEILQDEFEHFYDILMKYISEDKMLASTPKHVIQDMYCRMEYLKLPIEDPECGVFGYGIYLSISTIPHKCDPNLNLRFCGKTATLQAAKDFPIGITKIQFSLSYKNVVDYDLVFYMKSRSCQCKFCLYPHYDAIDCKKCKTVCVIQDTCCRGCNIPITDEMRYEYQMLTNKIQCVLLGDELGVELENLEHLYQDALSICTPLNSRTVNLLMKILNMAAENKDLSRVVKYGSTYIEVIGLYFSKFSMKYLRTLILVANICKHDDSQFMQKMKMEYEYLSKIYLTGRPKPLLR